MRKAFEVLMLRFAVYVLIGRNSHRCRFISRRDNNRLYYDGENIQNTIERMKGNYND